MNVRFKSNPEPCIQYRVIDDSEVIEYDETLNKYCPMIRIELMGLVPKELLIESTNPENTQAIDLYLELKK